MTFDTFRINYNLLALVIQARNEGHLPKEKKVLSVKTVRPK